MQCIDSAYEMTKDVYSNWKDYAYSYVLGRTLSMGTTNMIGLAMAGISIMSTTNSPYLHAGGEYSSLRGGHVTGCTDIL
jgi:hypothetical protein